MKYGSIVIAAILSIGFCSTLQSQWVQTTGPNGGQVNCLAVSGTNLFAGTYGGIYLSTNSGTSWTAVNSGLLDSAVFSLAVSGTNLFAGTNNGGVFLSTNNGASWTATSHGLGIRIVSALAVSPDGTGGTNLFAGTYGGIYLSTNSGTSWTVVDTMYGDQGVHSLLVSGTNIFAVYGPEKTIVPHSTEGLLLSTNNGTSWTEVSPGLPDSVVVSVAVSGTNLFAGGIGVNLSTNDGTTWTPDTAGMGSTVVLSFAVSEINVFAGTYSRGVFLSTNHHTSWTAVNSGLPIGNSSYVRALTWMGAYLFAGTDDGVWRRPISEMVTGVDMSSTEIPEMFKLDQNYPNPFNPATVVRYQLPWATSVRLVVYDILGREVSVLVNERRDAGVHEVKFDGNGLSSGVYFYRLQAGTFVETRKLLLVR